MVKCTENFVELEMDVFGPLHETEESYKFLIVFTDTVSKWVVAKPTKDDSIITISNVITSAVISNYGWPDTIISTKDASFNYKLSLIFGGNMNFINSGRSVINYCVFSIIVDLKDNWFIDYELFLLKYTNLPLTGNNPIKLLIGKDSVKRKNSDSVGSLDTKNLNLKKNNPYELKYPNSQVEVAAKGHYFEISSDDSQPNPRSDEQYSSLKGKNWLNDTVVNTYGTILTNRSRFCYLNSLIFSQILRSNDANLMKILKNLKDDGIDFQNTSVEILGIINVDSCHWIAFHMKPKKMILYYDPLRTERLDILQKFNLTIDKDFHYEIKQEPFIGQLDNYNCGVYCCFYIDWKINKRSKSNFNADLYRHKIYKKLKDNNK